MRNMSDLPPYTKIQINLLDKGGCSASAILGSDQSWEIVEADSGFDLRAATLCVARDQEDPLYIPLPHSSWLLTSHGLQCMADALHEGALFSTLDRYLELCSLVSLGESAILAPNLWIEASSL